ncbi:MAG: hypothetical protein M4D80_07650 [Myxococcota bacterium]|nr:hypothetical protein [Deltaproteobacteria bacterium]MDQ3335019.1 hypothetical protein [Myxococcota bacterium]
MSGVTFERLPPERRITAPSAASAGSCCCCCCCCLHTIGSLVGALTAKTPTPPEVVPTAVVGSDRADPNFRVTKEYWATVLVLCTVGLPLFAFSQGAGTEDFDMPSWLLIWAMFLPGIQLLASLVVVVRNQFSKRPGQRERMQHLGAITGRAFVGGMIGVLVMVVLGTVFIR